MGILRRLTRAVRPRHGNDARIPARDRKPARDAGQHQDPSEEETALRARLQEDPNDLAAFARLAELIRGRTAGTQQQDPLIADTGGSDLEAPVRASQWALAEELAGNPRAWYPLIELARLSLDDDHEAAMRRLGTACERDRSGRALEEGIKMLRTANLPAEALSLGVGHWAPSQQSPEAGRQVIRAALDAERAGEAREHLTNLATYGAEQPGTTEVVAELEPFVAAAEDQAGGSD